MIPPSGPIRAIPLGVWVIFGKILQLHLQGSFAALSPTPARAQQIRYNIARNLPSSDDPVSNVSPSDCYKKAREALAQTKAFSQRLGERIQKCNDFSSLFILLKDFEITETKDGKVIIPGYEVLKKEVHSVSYGLKTSERFNEYMLPQEKASILKPLDSALNSFDDLEKETKAELEKKVEEFNFPLTYFLKKLPGLQDSIKDKNFQVKLNGFLVLYSELKSCLQKLSCGSSSQNFEDFMDQYATCVSTSMSGGDPDADKILEVFATDNKDILEKSYKAFNALETGYNSWLLQCGYKLWLKSFCLEKDLAVKCVKPNTLKKILFVTTPEAYLEEKDLQQRKFDIFKFLLTSENKDVKRPLNVMLKLENREKFISQFDEEKQKEIEKLIATKSS